MIYSLNLILAAVVVYCIYEGISIKNHMKKNTFSIFREFTKLLFFMYFLVVLRYTFFPMDIQTEGFYVLNLVPIKETISMFNNSIGIAIYNVVGNILIFIPIGIFIPILFKKRDDFSSIIFYGVVGSSFIEINQLITGGRAADIDDVILNTIGALIGYLVYKAICKYFYKFEKIKNAVLLIGNDETKIIKKSAYILLPIFLFLQISVIHVRTEFEESFFKTEEEIIETFKEDTFREIVNSKDIKDGKIYLIKYGTEDEFDLGIEYYEKQNESQFILKESFYNRIEDEKKDIVFVNIKADGTSFNTLFIFGKINEVGKVKVIVDNFEKVIDIKEKGYFLEIIDISNENLSEAFELKVEFLKKN